MATTVDPAVYAWARTALGVDSAVVSDDALVMLATSEMRSLMQGYPCITTSGVLNLTGEDLEAYYEAVGYRVADRYFKTPAGQKLGATIIQVEVGPVKETRSSNLALTFSTKTQASASRAMRRIACVKDGATAPSYFAANGRRRSEGDACNVVSAAYGKACSPPCGESGLGQTELDDCLE